MAPRKGTRAGSKAEKKPTETVPKESVESNKAKPVEEPEIKQPEIKEPEIKESSTESPADTPKDGDSADTASAAKDRLARFKALQARAKKGSDQNLKEAKLESQRMATDPSALTSLQRQHAIASHKLLKAEVEESGGDFERKRAWDWTAEEAERWDRRVRKKEDNRDGNAFQDYAHEAEKHYSRQVKHMAAPDMEKYERDKMAAVERAAAAGGLDIVETADGELIAVDRDGSFYSTADSTTFAQNKPDKAAIDRLVGDLRQAEEVRLQKRRERMAKDGDDGDVTYINEKNKQFNQKLTRFYNKYTAEIRESFERGTRI